MKLFCTANLGKFCTIDCRDVECLTLLHAQLSPWAALKTTMRPHSSAAEWAVLSAQIRCGDLYADKAVEAFTACAVSDKKCVPQRVDASSFPVPPDCALDTSFDLNNFQVGTDSHCISSAHVPLPSINQS